MITPGIHRRSLRRGLRWRVLLLWWAALAVPGAIAAAPAFAFLRQHLDHSPRAPEVVAWMDGATLIELVRQLGEDGAARGLLFALGAAALALLVTSPFVAGAMVASARTDEPLLFRALLAGSGELYSPMLRLTVAGMVPLALGGGLTAGILKLASDADARALTETAADRIHLAAAAAAGLALFAAHLVVEAGRAQFAVHPERRSALAALWSGFRLLAGRPLRAVLIGALGTLVGLGLAAVLMALRLQIAQRGATTLALAWFLAQGAQVAFGWGRAIRIEGLAELSRAHTADRARRPSPPTALAPDPAQVVHSATLSALEPPPSGAPR
ncbi:MAG: hypothetical protein ACXWLR_00140 [Myxococcales bacterium]